VARTPPALPAWPDAQALQFRSGERPLHLFGPRMREPVSIPYPTSPVSTSTHLSPSLSVQEAGDNSKPFTVWGSGTPLRQFVFSEDLGALMIWVRTPARVGRSARRRSAPRRLVSTMLS
jgi:nucleoside-diphosphate-sugar epimerase